VISAAVAVTLATEQASALPISSIKLERSACFGTCPVYSVTIFSDGRVQYEGKEFVKEKGARTGAISAREFSELATKVERIGFLKLQAAYRAPVTDLPTTTVTVTRGRESKSVEDYFGAPQGLHDLEALIERTVKPWVDPSAGR
jgi:hypothetical protein